MGNSKSTFWTTVHCFFFPDFLSARNMVRVIEGKFIWKWSEGKQNLFRVSGRFELLDWASLRMVTRARKSSKASGKKKKNEKPRGKLGRRRERPLSSFPLGHFALSSPAELSTRPTEEGLLAVSSYRGSDEGKIPVNAWRKSKDNRFWFELSGVSCTISSGIGIKTSFETRVMSWKPYRVQRHVPDQSK